MTKNKQLTLIALFLIVFLGCREDIMVKYDRPAWLAGKLYTQIKANPDLSTFADLVHISGYDTIIDVSGSFTVFAPSNDAFKLYFQENSSYKSVAELPKAEVLKLVKYHLVQNPWSKKQLMTLDKDGWIDTLLLSNNTPKGYKRETLLLGQNKKYGVVYSPYKRMSSVLKRTSLIDTTSTSWHRKVFTDSRKFAPIFYKDYFDIYDLSTADYEFYFGRPFEANDIYYCGGRIISDEVFAENGFVYTIDRVVKPLKNGTEFLTDNTNANSYSTFYNLVNQFSELDYNLQATNKQPGAELGLIVDSLFNLTYPQLVFDINNEKTKPPKGEELKGSVTIRYHHGIVAPTNEALSQLVSQYLSGGNNWGSLEAAPENIKRIVANSSLSINPVYLTDVRKGFVNGELDNIIVDESSIVQKEYGSNCTFIGVNKPIVPRAFSSVTGPIYIRKGYAKIMFAIEKSGLLSALKRKGANYSFFVEPDESTAADSSFLFQPGFGPIPDRFYVSTLWPAAIRATVLSDQDLRLLLLNHVGTDQPKGMARKEFIKNLAGNYLIFDNVTKEVKGTAPSTYGYRGTRQVQVFPKKISTNSDNGSTYEISNWFNFSANNMYLTLSANFPKFHNLLKQAGYSDDKLLKYRFMSENQNYTVFAPSDSLLTTMNDYLNPVDTVGLRKRRQEFVLLHFIQGDLIFTDGNRPSGYYETARKDESSTAYTAVYTKIKIVPGVDQITIPALSGGQAVVVNESARTNSLTARNLSTTGTEAYTNALTNGVVHEIKNAIRLETVDRQPAK